MSTDPMSTAKVTFVAIEANSAGREASIRIENRGYGAITSTSSLRFAELPEDMRTALLAWIKATS